MRIVGINKRSYPAQPGHTLQTMDEGQAYTPGLHTLPHLLMRCDLMAVLTVGEVNDFAAYIGLGSDPEWVADHGDKLPEQEARVHFPGLPAGVAYRD
jgi:hypothetical protein